MSEPVLLRVTGLSKRFGAALALADVNLELKAGTVTALVGENGAGKSTLVKILTGVHQPDRGRVEWRGGCVHIASPMASEALGISVIHQESVVFEDLSVAENIFVTRRPHRFGLIHWREMYRRAGKLLRQLQSSIDPRERLKNLSVAERHVVQIARALCDDARLVIMDEPTAALSERESAELLRIVAQLREQGRAVLYISHKFAEIFAAADRYVVLRDGHSVAEGLMAQTSVDKLVKLMAGRAVDQRYPARLAAQTGDVVLRVRHLARRGEFRNVSFELHAGEVLGLYGLVGSGRSELLQVLFGLKPAADGEVQLFGEQPGPLTANGAIRAGMALVPEDRQQQGAHLSRSIRDNIALPNLPALSRFGFARRSAEEELAQDWIRLLQIKCRSSGQTLQELSGGNQQKAVLSKWLAGKPRVLLLDEPTKGIDIATKMAVHQLIRRLASQGLAILMVSSELPEVLGMSDRVLVMRRGLLSGEFLPSRATAEQVLHAATAA
jgi:rhamnose transport system ATP-binding protein